LIKIVYVFGGFMKKPIRSEIISIKVYPEIKKLIQSIAQDKDMTTSEYAEFVLMRGLDFIAIKNKQRIALEKQLGL